MSNLTLRLVSYTRGKKSKVLSLGVVKLSRLQARPGDLEIKSRSLNVELDLKISVIHMR